MMQHLNVAKYFVKVHVTSSHSEGLPVIPRSGVHTVGFQLHPTIVVNLSQTNISAEVRYQDQ